MVNAKIVTLQNESGEAIAPRTGATAIIMNNGSNLETALEQKANVSDLDAKANASEVNAALANKMNKTAIVMSASGTTLNITTS